MGIVGWFISLVLVFFGITSVSPGPTAAPTTVSAPAEIRFNQRDIAVGALKLEIPYPSIGAEPVSTTADVAGCSVPETDITLFRGPGLRFVQVPADCAIESRAPGNGFYGYFRTVADIPDPAAPHTVETPVGTATITSYGYFECTNSCTNGKVTVAIIALDSPADPGLPTLQIFQPALIGSGELAGIDLNSYVTGIYPG